MKKSLKLIFGILLSVLFISCGSSDEKIVKKYLPGTYIKERKEGEIIPFGYDKEIKIKHLKGSEYRVTCIGNDHVYRTRDENGRKIEKITPKTPDVYDFEISSITLNQETESVKKYFIKGIVTNIIEDGTTFSDADNGVNDTVILNFVVGKNIVEVNLGGYGPLAVREK